MANIEHVAQLEQGVEAWNQWRRNNPEIKPDLSEADLSLSDLNGANLSGANLQNADLSGANLSVANLSEANLRKAKLIGVDLNKAFLIGTDLTGADLSVADLSQSYLAMANLSKADLSVANLSNAELIKTQALGTNFKEAILTGACIEDWNIDSKTDLESVVCEYVFIRSDPRERRPREENQNFAPLEFAKLYQKTEAAPIAAPEQTKIGELFSKLQQAIAREANLSEKGKQKALKQLRILEKASQNSTNEGMEEIIEDATLAFKGILFDLPEHSESIGYSKDLLPELVEIFKSQSK